MGGDSERQDPLPLLQLGKQHTDELLHTPQNVFTPDGPQTCEHIVHSQVLV